MSDAIHSKEFALQICFGIFGILGTITTLASLHHRDSLGCVLLQSLRGHQLPRRTHDDVDHEASIDSLVDDDNIDSIKLPQRSVTMPPTYAQVEGNSNQLYVVDGLEIDAVLHASKVDKLLTEE